VAVGGGGALLVTDGEDWSPGLSREPSATSSSCVVWSGSSFVAVGASGTILSSNDGLAWAARSSGITATLRRVAWAGSQWVAVGGAGAILTSPDGANWTAQNSGTTKDLLAVSWNGSRVVAVGNPGAILSSADGMT
jgi:photosystem II stability/assembly factor-like uncharacterized protein